jgi:hypothetical protein
MGLWKARGHSPLTHREERIITGTNRKSQDAPKERSFEKRKELYLPEQTVRNRVAKTIEGEKKDIGIVRRESVSCRFVSRCFRGGSNELEFFWCERLDSKMR